MNDTRMVVLLWGEKHWLIRLVVQILSISAIYRQTDRQNAVAYRPTAYYHVIITTVITRRNVNTLEIQIGADSYVFRTSEPCTEHINPYPNTNP